MTLAELQRDVVILACAISAGIHGALVRDHPGFAAATVALAAIVVWLTRRPESGSGLLASAACLLGLLVAYGLAVTSGVPLLHPHPEPVDGLAIATKAVEAVGLLAAVSLLWQPLTSTQPRLKGTTT